MILLETPAQRRRAAVIANTAQWVGFNAACATAYRAESPVIVAKVSLVTKGGEEMTLNGAPLAHQRVTWTQHPADRERNPNHARRWGGAPEPKVHRFNENPWKRPLCRKGCGRFTVAPEGAERHVAAFGDPGWTCGVCLTEARLLALRQQESEPPEAALKGLDLSALDEGIF
jgi:hypothetical protein